MEYIVIGIVGTFLWMAFEMWKAPLLRENTDGSWTTIKDSKKIMDFFKKKNQKLNSYGCSIHRKFLEIIKNNE
jgi:hypothetical protein